MDRSQRVAAIANRLRLVQADFADETPEVREGYLSEIIQEALSTLTPEERPAFLQELRDRFPTWDASMTTSPDVEQPQAGVSVSDLREWNDISFVLQRLVELAQPLPEDQKERLMARLREAGLSREGQVNWPAQLVDQLRSRLLLDKTSAPDPNRVLELTVNLIDFAKGLDQLTWKIWKQIAKKANIRPASSLQETMGKFVGGHSDVPLSRNIEDLRHLIASLLSAISQIGSRFSQLHLARFAPNEIEANVKMETVGLDRFVKSTQVRCWEKYVELSKSLDDALIEREIMKIIEDFVASMAGR